MTEDSKQNSEGGSGKTEKGLKAERWGQKAEIFELGRRTAEFEILK